MTLTLACNNFDHFLSGCLLVAITSRLHEWQLVMKTSTFLGAYCGNVLLASSTSHTFIFVTLNRNLLV